MKTFTSKSLIIILVISITSSFFVPTKKADAFGPADLLNAGIQKIGHIITNVLSGGILGTTATSAVADTTTTAIELAEFTLKGLPLEYGPARTTLEQPVNACEAIGSNFLYSLADNLASSVAGVGDQTKVTGTLFISQKIVALSSKEACLLGIKNSYAAASVGAIQEIPLNAVRDSIADIEARLNGVKNERAQLEAQQKESLANIFKAIALGVALDINQQVTSQTINELKPKLAIGSYGKVADALAGQVYAVEFIKDNYQGDEQKQLILSSIINSKLVPDKSASKDYLSVANSLIEAKRNAECSSTYSLNDWTQPDFYKNLAEASSDKCNASFSFSQANDEANAIIKKSREAAQLELSNGQGFQSTRSCTDVTSQDNALRTQAAEFSRNFEVSKKARTEFENSGGSKSSPEYAELLKKENEAGQQILAAPQRVQGGVVKACGLVTDPGGFVANQLNNYVNQWLTQSTNLKNDNLPLFAKLAVSIKDKVFGGIILRKEKPGQVFSELGKSFINAGINAATTVSSVPSFPITGNTIPISGSDIGGSSGTTNPNAGNILKLQITPRGATSPVNPVMQPGSEYDLRIDIRELRSELLKPDSRFKGLSLRIIIIDDVTRRQFFSDIISKSDIETGSIILDFPVVGKSQSITAELYDEVAYNNKERPASPLTTAVLNYTVGSGAVQGRFTDVPLLPFTSAR